MIYIVETLDEGGLAVGSGVYKSHLKFELAIAKPFVEDAMQSIWEHRLQLSTIKRSVRPCSHR